jgi:sugar lactone lactonase YvrE
MLRKFGIEKQSPTKLIGVLVLAIFAVLFAASAQAASNIPPVTVSSTSTVVTGLLDKQLSVAVDACGNIYTAAAGYKDTAKGIDQGAGKVTEIPAGGGAPKVVYDAGGDDYIAGGLYIDSAKANLYIAAGSYNIHRIPIVNCSLQTNNVTSVSIGNLGAVSWWFTANQIAADASGNIFIAVNGACCAPGKELVEENADSSVGTTLLGGSTSLPAQIDSIAVDSANNIFFAMGGQVYELPYSSGAYASAQVPFGPTYNNASGVAFDSEGNLFVTDGGAGIVYKIPIESGTLNPNDQFIAAVNVTGTSNLAFGAGGLMYFTNNDTGVYALKFGGANLGTSAVGTAVSGTLNVAFNADETPSSFAVNAANTAFQISGGSCAASTAYTAGKSCTVNVTFNPSKPGVAASAVTIADASSNPLTEGYLSGVGTGAGLTVDPGAVATAVGTYTMPEGVAIDAAGNLFIADAGANAVYEIASGASTTVALGSGLSAPRGVAVDGAGNIFVADTGNNQIVEIPVVGGTPSTAAQVIAIPAGTSVAGHTLNAPEAVTVDGAGNLYIADTGNQRVVYVPFDSVLAPSRAQALGSGFNAPSAIALDSAGNIYVTDATAGKVFELKLPLTQILQSTVVSGYNNPTGLAIDASGALFVVDQGNQKLWRVPNVGGALVPTSALNVVGQLDANGNQIVASPFGVALDASGNAYVTDNANAAAYSVARTSSTQSAGIWSPATTSGTLSFQVENAGNAALTFGTPYETATGDVADFSLQSNSGACGDGGTVAIGANCLIDTLFTPTGFGDFTYTLALSSNAANASNQTVAFTGTGAVTVSTTTTIVQTSPSGAPAYDQAVTFGVTVSSSNGTPAGSVSLLVDGITKQTTALNNGTVSFTLAGGVLAGGHHTIQAKYIGGLNGNNYYSASTSSSLTINVATVATTTTLAYTSLNVAPNSQPAGTPLVLTATVATLFAGVPGGSVTFSIVDSGGSTSSGTAALIVGTGGSFQATYTYTPVAPAARVAYDVVSITATYSGDINFGGSASASSTLNVSGSQGSVATTASGTSITSSATQNGTVTFTATSYGGWSGIVGFSCDPTTLPAHARCVFSPGQIAIDANTSSLTYPPATAQMWVTIDQAPQTTTVSGVVWWIAIPTGLLLLVAFRRAKLTVVTNGWSALLLIIGVGALSLGIAGAVGCSSGGVAFATPKGTNQVTVTASGAPYVTSPKLDTTKTQTCSTSSTYPCFQQSFTVNVTVQ